MSEHYKYVDNDEMNWWLCDGSWLLRTDQVNNLDQIISLSYFLPRETNVDPSICFNKKGETKLLLKFFSSALLFGFTSAEV